MSKYKKGNILLSHQLAEPEEHFTEADLKGLQSINYLLGITVEQNQNIINEQETIHQIKKNYQNLIDQLLKCKEGFFKESMRIEASLANLKTLLSSEQIAKLLILIEKLKEQADFSVFNIWNIKKVSQQMSQDNDMALQSDDDELS